MSTIEAQVIQTLKTSPISATITGKTVTQIRQEIIDHMENTNNPHSVTCDQIGAMPYNKNIVIDENYVHTDNNFSNTYKTELDNLKNNYTTKSEHNNLNSTMKTLLNTKVDKKENFDLSKVKDLRYENNYLTIINQNNIGTKIECTGEKYVQDSINNSIVGNDIASHTLYTEGYLKDGKFIQLENSPIILNSLEDIITHAGYYAIANNLFEIDGKGYRLFYINSSNTNITVEDFINSDNAENHITNNYQINSSNQTVFGNNNIVSANNAITGGTNNINTGNNSITIGENNCNNGSDAIIAGQNNTNDHQGSAIFGARNEINEKQCFVTGYNNKILSGAYFASSHGVGNINQGTATTTTGGYNLAGSEYSSAEGIENIAGGNVTYNNIAISDIAFYSKTTKYTTGDIIKRNGFVFAALKNSVGITPSPTTNLDYWEIVKPVITTNYAKASKASGIKCIAKNTGAFVHGYKLKSAKNYQTVVGQLNEENTSALFVVGSGSENNRANALEVTADSTNINNIVNIKGGNTTGVLRETTSGELVVSGEGGIRLRPTSTSSNRGGISIKDGYIAPEMTSSLGTSSNEFTSAYLQNTVYLNGKNIKNLFADRLVAKINNDTYTLNLQLKTYYGDILSSTTIDLPLETMVIGATYSDSKLHLTLKNGEILDIDISDIIKGLVSDTTTINGKALSTDIVLTASDVDTYTSTEIDSKLNSKANISDIPTDYVPVTRKINNKDISTDINLSASDIGTYSTDEINNILQDKANISDLPTNYVPNNRTINGKALTEDIVLTPDDIGALSNTTVIPSKISDLTNDSNFLTEIPSDYVTEQELNSKGYLTEVPAEYVTETELNNKVDKIEGKSLSTEDFTTELKDKVENLPSAEQIPYNENIIINYNFCVNQRSKNVYSVGETATYCLDRWLKDKDVEVKIIDADTNLIPEAIEMCNTSTTELQGIGQFIADIDNYRGKYLTFSVQKGTTTDDISTLTVLIPNEETKGLHKVIKKVTTSWGALSFDFMGDNYMFRILLNPTTSDTQNYHTIYYVKGERGQVATPINTTSYNIELEKCLKYYQTSNELMSPANLIYYNNYTIYSVQIPLSRPMNINPTVTMAETSSKIRYDNTNITVTFDNIYATQSNVYDTAIVVMFRQIVDNSEYMASEGFIKYNNIMMFPPKLILDGEVYL